MELSLHSLNQIPTPLLNHQYYCIEEWNHCVLFRCLFIFRTVCCTSTASFWMVPSGFSVLCPQVNFSQQYC